MAGDSPVCVPEELVARAERTTGRVAVLQSALRAAGFEELLYPFVTVYGTGSLGRRELGPTSDLDIFILDAADDREQRMGNLAQIELFAQLISAGAAAEFRPFSADGRYLHVHQLELLRKSLGTPDDDHFNRLTARMLLLLESLCLTGSAGYERSIEFVADVYWRDADGGRPFKPLFLLNDIIRYWKSLCLAYEAVRRERFDPKRGGFEPGEPRLENLKLKFNRAWMCFNALCYLLARYDNERGLERSAVLEMTSLSPVERMLQVAQLVPATAELIQRLLDLYAEFLQASGREKPEVLAWLGDGDEWHKARDNGNLFGQTLFDLAEKLAVRVDLFRYLLV